MTTRKYAAFLCLPARPKVIASPFLFSASFHRHVPVHVLPSTANSLRVSLFFKVISMLLVCSPAPSKVQSVFRAVNETTSNGLSFSLISFDSTKFLLFHSVISRKFIESFSGIPGAYHRLLTNMMSTHYIFFSRNVENHGKNVWWNTSQLASLLLAYASRWLFQPCEWTACDANVCVFMHKSKWENKRLRNLHVSINKIN